MKKDLHTYDLSKEVIGIGSDRCFVCGKEKSTRHHVLPKEIKPLKNVTIPLCKDHKDIMHHVIKQFYFPKSLRNKLSKAKKHSEDVLAIINSVKKNLNWNTHKSTNTNGGNN